MKKTVLKSQAGFSLIELMIVVAIIGILAAIAIPNYSRFQAKARQSEARSLLSGIYTAEKAYSAEYSDFMSDFSAIGFSPEGQLRYVVGFAAATGNGYPVNYTGPQNAGWIDSAAYCAANAALCTDVSVAQGRPAAALAATAVTTATATVGDTFIANAEGNIDEDATIDFWNVDQAKLFTQVGGSDL